MSFLLAQTGAHPSSVKYAYLNLRDHPRGTLMLAELLSAGFVPAVVIEEDSMLAEQGRAGQMASLQTVPGFVAPPATRELCASHGVPYHTVADHNDEDCRALLAACAPDWILLGDTRVLRQHIYGIATRATLNTHPGFLPEVRGNHPYIWAIVDGLPQGVSVHVLDPGVDTGPLLRRRQLQLPQGGMQFGELVHRLNEMCAQLLREVMVDLVGPGITAHPQEPGVRPTYRAAPPEVRRRAIALLQSGEAGEPDARRAPVASAER
jgi:methionyl-tRNA formyltransferase